MGKTYKKEKGYNSLFDEFDDYFYGERKTNKAKNKRRKEAPLSEYETDEDHVFIEKMRKRK
jgi:hypothetical protein